MTYSLKVIDIRRESHDSKTLVFKQPGLRKIKYRAGQFLIIILSIAGRRYRRAYSLSSSPTLNHNLCITIKRIPGGVISNYLFDNCKKGDVIEVMGPMGEFVYDFENPATDIFLWGAGSGITPLFSILNEVLVRNHNTRIYLFYGNTSFENSIFIKELIELQKNNSDRLILKLFFSQEKMQKNSDFNFGRITKESIADFFTVNQFKLESGIHFICGPSEMKAMITDTLSLLQVKKQNILTEDFGLVVSEKELENIVDSNVTLLMNNNLTTVHVRKGKSILDAFLDLNYYLPYSCQTGSCNTCKAVLRSGRAEMMGINERADLKVGEILLCCSFPLSDQIEIQI